MPHRRQPSSTMCIGALEGHRQTVPGPRLDIWNAVGHLPEGWGRNLPLSPIR